MAEFYIEWRIQVEAPTARAAAEKASEIMHRPGTTATVFHVSDASGEFEVVDLLEVDE